MRPSVTSTALLIILPFSHAVAIPLAEEFTHPIAYIPIPSFQANSLEPIIAPTVTILDKADLLTPGTVLSGSPGPGPRTSGTEKRDIIGGVDNRFLQIKTGNPWDYIGRLTFSFRNANGNYNAICSAALVGPRHLATAAHCSPYWDPNLGTLTSSVTFQPNYDQGTRGYTTAAVTNIFAVGPFNSTVVASCDEGNDWAIFVLNQRLGDKYGWFGMKMIDPSKRSNFWHEGYPSDLGGAQRPYVQERISRTHILTCAAGVSPYLWTDADANHGQSGGPLWLLPEADGVRYLYGVLSMGSAQVSLFGGGQPLVNAAARARQQFS